MPLGSQVPPCELATACPTFLTLQECRACHWHPAERSTKSWHRNPACHTCRLKKEVEYQQAFTAEDARLCLVCLAPIADCPHPPDAVLPGAMDLFCGQALDGGFCSWSVVMD